MFGRTRAAVAGALVTLLTATGLLQAVAAPGEPQPPGADSGEAADIAAYSRTSGTSIDQIKDYVEGSGEFGQAAAWVEQTMPAHYVTAIWDGPTSPRTAIYVKPAVQAQVAVRYPRWRIIGLDRPSQAELGETALRLATDLAKVPGVTGVGASIEPVTGVARIEYLGSATLAQVLAAARRLSLTGVTGFEIKRAPGGRPVGEPEPQTAPRRG